MPCPTVAAPSRRELMSAMAVLVGLLTAAPAQDVFVGGRVDLEWVIGQAAKADFGREAGCDLTFSQPGVLDAYLDLSVAGGEARVQEFYLSPPQTRQWVELVAGRFLLPHGYQWTRFEDRYVAGATDLFTTYDGFRQGNVLLDTDVTGLWLSRSVGPTRLDLYAGDGAGDAGTVVGGRVVGGLGAWQLGASLAWGEDERQADLRQLVLHAGWRGERWFGYLQGYLGEGSGGDHRGFSSRVEWTCPRLPVTFLLGHTLANDDTMAAVTTTRFGAKARLADIYRLETRYEINHAPGAAGDDRLVFRAGVVF